MRSRLAWVLGGLGVGGALALRALRREAASAPVAEPPAPPADGRAEELRRKLEESRAVVDEREAFESGETTVDEAEPAPQETPSDRRRHVHQRARASVDRMQRSTADDAGSG